MTNYQSLPDKKASDGEFKPLSNRSHEPEKQLVTQAIIKKGN
jgi:hypothetical protein